MQQETYVAIVQKKLSVQCYVINLENIFFRQIQCSMFFLNLVFCVCTYM